MTLSRTLATARKLAQEVLGAAACSSVNSSGWTKNTTRPELVPVSTASAAQNHDVHLIAGPPLAGSMEVTATLFSKDIAHCTLAFLGILGVE